MNDLQRATRHFEFARSCFRLGLGLCVLAIGMLSGIALAQVPAPAAADVDVNALLKLMLDGAQTGNWWLAAGPTLTLIVFAVRKYDKLIPVIGVKVDAFLNQPLVAFLLPVVLSALTGLTAALGSGQPIGPALLASLKVAAAATMSFMLVKNAAEQAAKKGDAAVAAVTTPQAAAAVINDPAPTPKAR